MELVAKARSVMEKHTPIEQEPTKLLPTNKIIVTGATGFVGRHVVKKLIDHKYDVYALALDLDKASSLECLKNARHFYFDIANLNTIENLPKDAILVHCAWQDVRDTLSLKHIEEHLMTNYLLVRKFIEHGIKQIVVTGTCYEYGLQYGPIKANTPTQPNTAYAIAKDTLHKSLRALQTQVFFELIWARLFYIYGEGQDERSIISLFDKALQNSDEIFNMSLGEQLFDYLPVEEVATKIVNLLQYKNGIFNICSGKPISLRRLLENRAKDKGKNIKLNLGFYEYREQDALAIWGIPSEFDEPVN